jgi:hypothetical protein
VLSEASHKFQLTDIWWLVGLYVFAALAATVAHVMLPKEGWLNSEYGMPAMEFQQTHHISSVFLPIGYSAFVGIARIMCHGDAGLVAANVVIYMLWITLVWMVLQQLGMMAKQAFAASLAFAIYPDILLTINKASHLTLTSLMLVAFVSAAIWMVRSPVDYRADAVMAMVVGAAVLSRPNLLMFVPLAWFVLWRYKLPRALLRSLWQTAGAFALYAVVTITVHGSVFWPQMGPYNLFAGANEFTQQDMGLSYDNAAEGSIIPALKLRGIDAYHDWSRPDNVPGDNEIRNLRFEPIYIHGALEFIRRHPGTMLKLTWLKFVTFFRPDLQIHRLRSAAGMVKVLAASSFWIWAALCFVFRAEDDEATLIIALTIAAFVLPHLVTISAPRYRIPIDVLCLVSIVAMLFGHRKRRDREFLGYPRNP